MILVTSIAVICSIWAANLYSALEQLSSWFQYLLCGFCTGSATNASCNTGCSQQKCLKLLGKASDFCVQIRSDWLSCVNLQSLNLQNSWSSIEGMFLVVKWIHCCFLLCRPRVEDTLKIFHPSLSLSSALWPHNYHADWEQAYLGVPLHTEWWALRAQFRLWGCSVR